MVSQKIGFVQELQQSLLSLFQAPALVCICRQRLIHCSKRHDEFFNQTSSLPNLITQLDSRPIEDGLLGIVDQAILNHEFKVTSKLVYVHILMCLSLLPHGGEVHRVLHHVQSQPVSKPISQTDRQTGRDSNALYPPPPSQQAQRRSSAGLSPGFDQ
ncbi:hypothetical protein E2C01_003137 [Portunus trituberculatus]|uniref:Uncharacterized protein n=1 Tax=Portunus trituberculatus TaxID=210409 RepID=A0A5B7CM48_PORTR|nr:hypothetical protein [Portunus trituberculatus]